MGFNGEYDEYKKVSKCFIFFINTLLNSSTKKRVFVSLLENYNINTHYNESFHDKVRTDYGRKCCIDCIVVCVRTNYLLLCVRAYI